MLGDWVLTLSAGLKKTKVPPHPDTGNLVIIAPTRLHEGTTTDKLNQLNSNIVQFST